MTILKRGMSATVSEWLMAAEYIAAGGNHNIIFCELDGEPVAFGLVLPNINRFFDTSGTGWPVGFLA